MGYAEQQNKIWPPSQIQPGTVMVEPLLRQGDLWMDQTNGYYYKCDSPTYPATWSIVGPPAPSTTFQLAGAVDSTISFLDTELVIGGFTLDGNAFSNISFRLLGRFSPGTGGQFNLRLYDMGPLSGSPIVPELRSTLFIMPANADKIYSVALTLSAVPTPASPNEIMNTARLYELRVILSGCNVGDAGIVHWAGVEVS